MIKRLLCWLGGHFIRRTAARKPYTMLRCYTRARCWCGKYDLLIEGFVDHDYATDAARRLPRF